jgi:pyruvate/2-oxoglutarate dehydrogenase complex dihydrolipoamide acyltransferase (E2) component
MAIPIKMPQLGESVVTGTIIRWLKEPGDFVEKYEPLVEIGTDKIVTEVPASHAGVLVQIMLPAGETAEIGTVLAYLGEPDETAVSAEPVEAGSADRPALETVESASPVSKASPLTPMRAAIAEHMLRSIQTSAHVTSVFEVDLSQVVAYRQDHQQDFARQGINLAYTAFFVQAAVEALRAYPMANASLIEGKVVRHPQINIGVAVAVEGGLLVPVIKRAEELSLKGLARAVNDLATRARSKKLTPDEVREGTFTVTNPGMQGALFGTAIIHQPQTAILGVGAIVKRPVVVEEDAIVIRPMVYVSLTYDHRLLDGFGANQVLAAIRDFLETYPSRTAKD